MRRLLGRACTSPAPASHRGVPPAPRPRPAHRVGRRLSATSSGLRVASPGTDSRRTDRPGRSPRFKRRAHRHEGVLHGCHQRPGFVIAAPPCSTARRRRGGRRAGWLARPRYQAFALLRITFTVAPIAFGLDKFFNVLVDWPITCPLDQRHRPRLPPRLHVFVGATEILAGVTSPSNPASAPTSSPPGWQASSSTSDRLGHYDIALRDFRLMLAALTLTGSPPSTRPAVPARHR